MKLSDYVIDFLVRKKVNHAFSLIGGASAHLVDSLYRRRADIKPVCVQHEQAAAFAAEASARISQNIGVAITTSGPGATNLITGIGSAFYDSIPCLFLTGQVNTYDYSGDSPQRQRGFQETDIVTIASSITKDAVFVDDPNTIRYHLEKAFYLATEGRPGPVLIDLPMNIQRAEIDVETLCGFEKEHNEIKKKAALESLQLDSLAEKVISLINKATRPVILVGGGVRISDATNELMELVVKTKIPVVVTYAGKDAINNTHPSFAGFVGNYGHRTANFTIANSDLLLVLGSRLDTRTTGSRGDLFAREATIIHVDIDPHEINQRVKCDIPVLADIGDFLKVLNTIIRISEPLEISAWLKIVANYKKQYPWIPVEHTKEKEKVDYYEFMQILSEELDDTDIIVSDNGQARVWALQVLSIRARQRFVSSVGMASLGYGLPASIGAALAANDGRVICIVGDGGMQFNIQELQTIVHYKIPIKIFVLNNHSYGMIKQFQKLYFDGRTCGTGEGYSCPDFAKVATSYGLSSCTIENGANIRQAIQNVLQGDDASLCNVVLPSETSIIPKVKVNYPIEDAEPLLDRKEFLSNMIITPFSPQ